MKIPRRT